MKNESIKDKLLKSVLVNNKSDCWEWTKGKDKNGYGKIFHEGKHWRAHRLSYVLFLNENLDHHLVCHKCDNPSCINPKHLFLGTWLTNMQDKVQKGRLKNQNMGKTHCKRGHEFIGDNVIMKGKKRVCKTCYENRWRKRNSKVISDHQKETIRKSGIGTFCKNGHEFKEENTIVSKTGARRCRICENEYQRLRKKGSLRMSLA